MTEIYPHRADSEPPDGLVAANILLRQEPNEEEDEVEEEEEDEGNGKEDADDDATDDGYSEWARS
jgi:hypothetical protein